MFMFHGGDIVHVMEETLFMLWRRHCSCDGGDIVHVMEEHCSPPSQETLFM